MKMPAKSKRDAAETIRTTDKRAVEIMKERGLCSFSEAYALALDESSSRTSGMVPALASPPRSTNSPAHRTG